MKKVIILLLLLSLVAMPSFAERKFGRYEGRALRCALPLYQGTPSSQYIYKSLGNVENVQKWNFHSQGEIAYAALEGLANKAKAMGANAIIKVEPNPRGLVKGYGDFGYAGEAVTFDKLPEKPYK
ncbi:MAG: hypothetical protein Q8R14_00090 [Candidatus Omnitrophota bacterium]|nr:hypothetical protein [Candidatus Omnitrophota bacterium]